MEKVGVDRVRWPFFLTRESTAVNIEPDVPIVTQLAGSGQLRDLRRNPNFKGVDINFLLTLTPNQLEEMLGNEEIDSKTYKQIFKAFEGRDLGKRGKNK
jgi:hypothetical protein